ncbi:MAG: malonyl CoA-acyl carrier protein transacylase [Chloroflexota bacterium]|nr:MAG: malonyl CoA-acyl carrier protein transacylase [Chloroflexota bacterium]
MTTAWLFPGQGSQFVGMARDLYETYASARAVIDAADAALGFALSKLMFEGPEAELTDTLNAQPALLTHSIAALAALQQAAAFNLPTATLCAGHSLGEYSALVAAGALDFADGIKLVRARGAAMKRAGELRPGAMAALIGLDDAKLNEICQTAGAVQIANYNAPGQIVLSGEQGALERAVELAKQAGAKRAIVLAVSIAAHSELMRSAVEDFRAAVFNTPLNIPNLPIVSNVTAQPMREVATMRAEMLAQLTSAVQWTRSVELMHAQGVSVFLELGPKDVLTGLNKRIARGAAAYPLGTFEQIAKYVEGMSQ